MYNVYDDFYFECDSLSPFTLDYALPTAPDIYVCHSGFIGGPEACSFAFDDLSVRADLPSLIVDSCIEMTEVITSFPTLSPDPSSSFDYSIRFDCTSANSTIIVSCENDARIDFVTAMDSSMNCTEISYDVWVI
jgi:hypothetical protein